MKFISEVNATFPPGKSNACPFKHTQSVSIEIHMGWKFKIKAIHKKKISY
jgi:hypothetical protein